MADLTDLTTGTPVVYRPHPNTQAEDGTVVRVSDNGLVFVLYRGDGTPKATRAEDLEVLRG